MRRAYAWRAACFLFCGVWRGWSVGSGRGCGWCIGSRFLSRDPAVVQDFRDDPLVCHGKFPTRTGAEILATGQQILDAAATLRVPVLLLHGTGDRVTDPGGSQLLFDRATAADKSLKLYPGLYHDLFHEPEHRQITADVLQWLTQHCAGAQRGGPTHRPRQNPPGRQPYASRVGRCVGQARRQEWVGEERGAWHVTLKPGGSLCSAISRNRKHRGLGFLIFLVVCFAAAGMGGAVTTPKIGTWYATLAKPSWNPPIDRPCLVGSVSGHGRRRLVGLAEKTGWGKAEGRWPCSRFN